MVAWLGVCAGSSAVVVSVNATSGRRSRTRAAIRVASRAVFSRLVPSGARTLTSNSDWSSSGMNVLFAAMNNGAVDSNTSSAPAITSRVCAIAQASMRPYSASIGAKNPVLPCSPGRWTPGPGDPGDGVPSPSFVAGRRRRRADIIGVSVNATSSDTAIAKAIVRPNDFMKRPTMPPMNPTGTKIAMSDSVVAMTASPISRVASIAA